MSETPGNARLEDFLREQIPRLAVLYDRFAYALDPFDQGRDIAEQPSTANWQTGSIACQSRSQRFANFADA